MTFNDFHKHPTLRNWATNCLGFTGTYLHKSLPLSVRVYRFTDATNGTTTDEYYWYLFPNRETIDLLRWTGAAKELENRKPEDISDEEINLLLLKYAAI